ncbi:60S ribosomal protein L26-like [Phoca vitulina]|uniref:60S ribosomal protein L26-like n=1 Tax=Phoca vitulina TaxID=9720 RepID=UPI00139660E1|nr:60S ribosomal protein L26-like [Phoca vitulina]XP_035936074.1 60S ribosomal protein L26-like [Halichoerus grypus]
MPIRKDDEYRLCKDTTKVSKLAKSSRFTGRNTSSTLNKYSERRRVAHLSMWAFILARWLALDCNWTKTAKGPEHKAKSHQVGKEKGKLKEETIEKMQE